MYIVQTDRLILRTFRSSDLEDFYNYAKNPGVGPYAGWKPHDNRAESAMILRGFIEKGEVLAMVEKTTDKVVGSIALLNDEKRNHEQTKQLAYALSVGVWGRGYATEAGKALIEFGFNKLELKIISAYHFPFNNRSKRVIKKCGFQYEGVLRGVTQIWTGEIYDNACYSLTAKEYFSFCEKEKMENDLLR